ncbi:hypothetical protein SDC9_147413 [bioreactor metagenome]|uniref:Uncharacterized protein n=1 Tax=bioreactor metagenome TaxID=1076179 RepID=A0A645EGF0_9ZZZZ
MILRKVKQQPAQHRVVLEHHAHRERIDRRQQRIPKANELCDRVEIWLAGCAKVPDFARRVRSVGAKQRQERAKLQPAHVEFAVGGVVYPVVIVPVPEPNRLCGGVVAPFAPASRRAHKKRADVHRPKRNPAQAEVDSLGNLAPEHVPARGGIPRPERNAVSLAAGVAGTREVHHAHIRSRGTFVLEDSLRVFECKKICHGGIEVFLVLAAHEAVALLLRQQLLAEPVRRGKRLRGIAPPGVKSTRHELAFQLLPV